MTRYYTNSEGAVLTTEAPGGVVPSTAYKRGGLSFTPDGALYTSPSSTQFIVSPSGGVDVTKLKKWTTARGKVKAGLSGAKVLCIGDSTTRGTGSANSATANVITGSWPSHLARILTTAGYKASGNCFMGDGNALGNATADPRVTVGAGWVFTSAVVSLGGLSVANSSTTNNLSYAFTDTTFDTIDVYFYQGNTLGVFTIAVDGGAALATATQSGTGAFAKLTASTTLATHTVNIARTTGGGAYIFGVCAYNSATPEIQVINAGISGGSVCNGVSGATDSYTSMSYDTAKPYDRITCIPTLAPDLTIIYLEGNDARQTSGISVAAFTAAYQNIITAALTSGDVILVVQHPIDTTNIAQANQDSFGAAIRALAASNGLLCVDLYSRYGTNGSMPTGFYYDAAHLFSAGYSDVAQVIARVLMA